METKLIRRVVQYYIPISRLIETHSETRISESGSCFCPFHDNINTPAAKIYANPEGESLFCFAEHKTYNSYDYITQVLMKDINPIFNAIWTRISESDKQYFLQFSPQFQDNYLKDELYLIKIGRMSYDRFLQKIIEEVS